MSDSNDIIPQLNTAMGALETSVTNITNLSATYSNTNAQTKTMVSTISATIDAINEKITAFTTQINAMRQQLVELDRLKTQIAALQQQNTELQAVAQQNATELAQLNEDAAKLKRAQDSLEADKQTLTTALTTAITKMNEMTTGLNGITNSNATSEEVKQQLVVLQQKINSIDKLLTPQTGGYIYSNLRSSTVNRQRRRYRKSKRSRSKRSRSSRLRRTYRSRARK